MIRCWLLSRILTAFHLYACLNYLNNWIYLLLKIRTYSAMNASVSGQSLITSWSLLRKSIYSRFLPLGIILLGQQFTLAFFFVIGWHVLVSQNSFSISCICVYVSFLIPYLVYFFNLIRESRLMNYLFYCLLVCWIIFKEPAFGLFIPSIVFCLFH